MVGIKGTGVCALAEILVSMGAVISGSDVADTFYTDSILHALDIIVLPFDAQNITKNLDLIIYSAAYNPAHHPELRHAYQLGIPLVSYTEALGALSRTMISSGICGVHGKTTTTALAGVIAQAAGMPATILAGSAVSAFGNRSTLQLGKRYFIAETCEYRRHFLDFSPHFIVLTSIEPDHQDYYPDFAAISAAFKDYLHRLPQGGTLVHCSDDPGATIVAKDFLVERPDVRTIPYGFGATGTYQIHDYSVCDGYAEFSLGAYQEPFRLKIPGRHSVLDAVAAIALCSAIGIADGLEWDGSQLAAVRKALASFSGSRRRSEIIGEVKGILFMDDYAHHPTAIRTTLAGLKEFYPSRRLVVDFMPHTYSRTKALFTDFASAFDRADEVILHKIYASAREAVDPTVTGQALHAAMLSRGLCTRYYEEPMNAEPYLAKTLDSNDLFITMGAGDNWLLGKYLYEKFTAMQTPANKGIL